MTESLDALFEEFNVAADDIIDAHDQGLSQTSWPSLFNSLKILTQEERFAPLIACRHSDDLNQKFSEIRTIYTQYYQQLEQNAARFFLKSRSNVNYMFRSHNHELAFAEGYGSKLTENSRVAFVGCGCFPWSALLLCQKFGCEIDGIDREVDLIELGRAVVEKLGLSRSFKMLACDGASVDYERYSHVFFAGMADSKRALFGQVGATGSDAVQIVLRSARPFHEMFYERFDEQNFEGFRLENKIIVPGSRELESLIYKKSGRCQG